MNDFVVIVLFCVIVLAPCLVALYISTHRGSKTEA